MVKFVGSRVFFFSNNIKFSLLFHSFAESRPCCINIWNKWIDFCFSLHHSLEKLFEKLAYLIGLRPYITIIVSLILTLTLMAGFYRFRMETRSDKLFVPENSRSIQDMDKASKYFTLKFRAEEFIMKSANSKPVLRTEVFQAALDLHNHISKIKDTEDICLLTSLPSNSTKSCIGLNYLELFNFYINTTKDILARLTEAYNRNVPMSNLKLPKSNFPSMFGGLKTDAKNNTVLSAGAIKITYFLKYHDTEDLYQQALTWEKTFSDYLASQETALKSKGIDLFYYSGRSLDDSISSSAFDDLKLIIISFVLMIAFCFVCNARCRRRVNGHMLLALAGINAVILGIGSSFGLVMFTGTPFVGMVGVLPFLILGVGIDDMFILIDTLDQRLPNIRGLDRLTATLSHAGASITMTTVTDLVAFAVSTVTTFAAIRYFCLYAALAITFVYLLMVTFFIAVMRLDVNRVEAGRHDFCPCCISQKYVANPWLLEKSDFSNKVSLIYFLVQ